MVGTRQASGTVDEASVGRTNGAKQRKTRRSARCCSCSLADGEWRMSGRKSPRAAVSNAVGQRVTDGGWRELLEKAMYVSDKDGQGCVVASKVHSFSLSSGPDEERGRKKK